MSFLTLLNGRLPFEVSITGRKRNLLFGAFDTVFSSTAHNDVISTPVGPISIDHRQAAERWLSYAFFNILRHYRRSDLGRLLAEPHAADAAFVDIGANLGFYSFIARMNGYRTYLVEPEPKHVSFLGRNTATFGDLIGKALSDRTGELPLYYEEENTGATSLVPASGYKKSTAVVPVVTFESLVSDGTISDPGNIRLIKIDVEGAEANAVAGMRGFLEAGHRPRIWCEVRGNLSGRAPGSYREVIDILTPYGYSAFECVEGATRAAQDASLANRGVFDLLFESRP
jgi:FkbM family methyltransferase